MNCILGLFLICLIVALIVMALRRRRDPEEKYVPPSSPSDDVIPFIELPEGLPRVAEDPARDNVDDQRVVAGLLKSMRDERHLWRHASEAERPFPYTGYLCRVICYTPTGVVSYHDYGIDECVHITCGPTIYHPDTIKLYCALADEIIGFAATKRAEKRMHVAQRNEFILKIKS